MEKGQEEKENVARRDSVVHLMWTREPNGSVAADKNMQIPHSVELIMLFVILWGVCVLH